MAIRKLNKTQQAEIAHAFKSGNCNEKDLAQFYGVSTTTIRHVLADAGLVEAKAHKTPDQVALLGHLKKLGITTVAEFNTIVLKLVKEAAYEIYKELPLEQRTHWLVESIKDSLPPKLETSNTPTSFKEESNVKHSRNPTPKVPIIQ